MLGIPFEWLEFPFDRFKFL